MNERETRNRKKELLIREDGSLEPRQRIVISRDNLYRLLGISETSFVRTILLTGSYQFRHTESSGTVDRIRLFGGEINWLRRVIQQKRADGEINPSHRRQSKPVKILIH